MFRQINRGGWGFGAAFCFFWSCFFAPVADALEVDAGGVAGEAAGPGLEEPSLRVAAFASASSIAPAEAGALDFFFLGIAGNVSFCRDGNKRYVPQPADELFPVRC